MNGSGEGNTRKEAPSRSRKVLNTFIRQLIIRELMGTADDLSSISEGVGPAHVSPRLWGKIGRHLIWLGMKTEGNEFITRTRVSGRN